MARELPDTGWERMIEDVVTGMRDWRTAHPKATFAEMEATVDERLDRVCARMLEEAALVRRSTDLSGVLAEERPVCARCGRQMQVRGQQERTLTVRGVAGRCACSAVIPPVRAAGPG